jgi:uncharacterized protein YoxC
MTMQPTDIALFLISFAACVYCIVLSGRLRKLQNTKNGLGATILALNESVSAVTASTRDSKQQASDIAGKLTLALRDAQETCLRLQALSDSLEARAAAALQNSEAAHRETQTQIAALLQEADARMTEMNTLNEQMRLLTHGTTETIVQAIHRAAKSQSMTASGRIARYE